MRPTVTNPRLMDLNLPLAQLTNIVRVRTPPRLPVVLSRQEVKTLLDRLDGIPWSPADKL